MDKKGSFAYDLSSYLHCLSELRAIGNKDPSQSVKHLYFVFLILGTFDDFSDFVDAGLSSTVTSDLNVAIISGSLRDWKFAIYTLASKNYRDEIRPICFELLDYFNLQWGLGEFFSDLKRVEETKTCYLERK